MNSIKKKVLAITLVLLLLSLSVVSIIFAALSFNGTLTTVETIMGETAKTAAKNVANKLVSTENIIQELGTISRLTNPDSTLESKQEILNSKIKKFNFIDLTVTDVKGISLQNTDYSGEEYFQKAVKGEVFAGEPEKSSDGNMVMHLAAPLWKDGLYDTEIAGTIIVTLDGKYLSNITNNITVGKSGHCYILDKQGTTIAYTDFESVKAQDNSINDAKSDSSLKDLASLEQRAIKGEECFGTMEFSGIKKIVFYTPVPGTNGWSLGISVAKNEFMKTIYRAVAVSTGISVIALILAGIIMVAFATKLVRPIKEMENVVYEISQGNFDVDITYQSNDEIGKMAESMRSMISSTKEIIDDTARALGEMAQCNFDVYSEVEYVGVYKNIKSAMHNIITELNQTLSNIKISAEQVNLGAEQVASGSQSLAQGSVEQTSSIEKLSESVSLISDQIKQNAQNAESANSQSAKVESELEHSNMQMNKMMDAMGDISGKSTEISKIIKAIEDIAFQTNILALNAAVEAARAGTAGKGFAVVADEVRNLAGKSAEAAKNTTSLIEDTVSAVEDGTSIAAETAEVINTVVQSTKQVVSAITEIARASAEQADSISQITVGLDEISAVVQSNSATAEESAAASEELSGQANLLQDSVRKFKLK
ncbi:methyl-accepting chemotaxis protein [Aminipila terrae]|uniref:HAMP domain-containing protein n=1 Tax=Aminipila terrae TaxID=2697030 RepID=A0A6P1MJB1_9FIRM|nr:methyl-accepting chemotaxis protein [Aminipila terrae]QHI73283.1 HAMP domain-containing protein [Aminipila terrae]